MANEVDDVHKMFEEEKEKLMALDGAGLVEKMRMLNYVDSEVRRKRSLMEKDEKYNAHLLSAALDDWDDYLQTEILPQLVA